jgi:hypothetical protein
VIGPAAIDVRECEFPADTRDDCDAGAYDQLFYFQSLSATHFKIRTSNGECVATREDIISNSEAIQFTCQESANQNFELIFQAPIGAAVDGNCIKQQGWRGDGPAAVYAHSVAGVNLYGGDYRNEATNDDGGYQCGIMCAEDQRCRAFSWVRPGVQGVTAMCWLKDQVPAPNRDDNTASGIVRP